MQPKNSITIVGRRWFQRTNGNTYHSAEAYYNGDLVGRVGFRYGYDSQWEWTARDILQQAVKLPGIEKTESLWRYCERKSITLVQSCTDVKRKRDL